MKNKKRPVLSAPPKPFAIVGANIYPVGNIAPGDGSAQRWVVVKVSGCSTVIEAESVTKVIQILEHPQAWVDDIDPILTIAHCVLVEQVKPHDLKDNDQVAYPGREGKFKLWAYRGQMSGYALFTGVGTLSVLIDEYTTFYRVVKTK